MNRTYMLVLACLFVVCAAPSLAVAVVYDATTDFSTTDNDGSDGWQYEKGTSALGLSLETSFTGSMLVGPGDYAWGYSQAGWWSGSGGANYENWAITNQNNPLGRDVLLGDLVSHGNASIGFKATAGTAGTYSVDLSVWQIRDADRAVSALLTLNGSTLASATVSNTGTPTSSRALQQVVANDLLVTLAAGDILRFENEQIGMDSPDFLGAVFTLTPAAIPEPSSVTLATISGLALAAFSRRRRRSLQR